MAALISRLTPASEHLSELLAHTETFWKWFGKSRYPGALSPVLENFRRAYSLDPTDCPWVSEDGVPRTRLPPQPQANHPDLNEGKRRIGYFLND